MTTLHVLQHVPCEGPGRLVDWAASRDFTVRITRLFADPAPPRAAAGDWLVVMGGPMGANDDRRFPWMPDEKRVIAAALDAGARVVGICLGAQLIAAVCGARVYRNDEPEIGWFPVTRAAGAAAHPLAAVLPRSFTPLHWHGDTFDLPRGMQHLYASRGCRRQMFADASGRVVGLQFHLEMTVDSARALAAADPLPPPARPYVQTLDDIVAEPRRFTKANDLLEHLLDRIAAAE